MHPHFEFPGILRDPQIRQMGTDCPQNEFPRNSPGAPIFRCFRKAENGKWGSFELKRVLGPLIVMCSRMKCVVRHVLKYLLAFMNVSTGDHAKEDASGRSDMVLFACCTYSTTTTTTPLATTPLEHMLLKSSPVLSNPLKSSQILSDPLKSHQPLSKKSRAKPGIFLIKNDGI